MLDHLRTDTPCELQDRDNDEEFVDDAQMTELKSRKKRGPMSEEEKWVEVYKVLFPEDNFIPSACKRF